MSNSRLSKRYARALFSLGQEDGSFNQYGRGLDEFAVLFKENSDFRQVIGNPIFDSEDRKKLLDFVLERSGFSVLVKNFLNLLLDKQRIGAIETINKHYAMLTDEGAFGRETFVFDLAFGGRLVAFPIGSPF